MRRKGAVVACAIMKNEETEIRTTVESLRACLGPALAGIVIHDTGSTDRTNEIAVELGCVVECRLFDDFASARNAAIVSAIALRPGNEAVWILPFSAGARFSGKFKGAPGLAMVHTERRGGAEWSKVGPIRAGSGLRYEGRTHECFPIAPDGLAHCGITVDYSADAKDRHPRWELDLLLLENDYSPRGRYYYAQTLDCLGRYAEAFAAYMHRVEQMGYEPERLRAVANAVRTAQTMRLARFVTALAPGCADVQLEMAWREERAGNVEAAKTFARIALACETRALFAITNLIGECERILAK